jgi:hypothetical protein
MSDDCLVRESEGGFVEAEGGFPGSVKRSRSEPSREGHCFAREGAPIWNPPEARSSGFAQGPRCSPRPRP